VGLRVVDNLTSLKYKNVWGFLDGTYALEEQLKAHADL
jgi:hypothetical protein